MFTAAPYVPGDENTECIAPGEVLSTLTFNIEQIREDFSRRCLADP